MTKQKSDLSRAFSEDGALKTHIGGQALIEGVMMRGKYNWAVGVREPDGNIYEEEHDLATGQKKYAWLYWPFVRGCRAMVESLVLGYKALEIAAMHAYGDEEEDSQTNLGNLSPRPTPDGLSAQGSFAQGPHDGVGSVNNYTEPTPVADFAQAPEAGGRQVASDSTRLVEVSDADLPAADFGPTPDADGRQDSQAASSFSWKDDFGNPQEMIDALGAQSSLEIVNEGAGGPAGVSAVAGSTCSDKNPEDSRESADEEEPEPFFGKREMAISMILGLVLGIVLFIVAPAVLTNLIVGEYDSNTLAWNIVDGLLRVAVFVFYIWLIGRMSDIKRMFGYHGAEHKTIHCYEHGLELTPENARQFPRLHVRCGTAFLIMVMIIAILVYTITPLNALIGAWGVPDGAPKLILVIIARIVLMPVIAGISYEITVRWAGSNPDNPLVKVVLWPGMQMQYLTTNEPDDSMLECAISAMKQVIAREEAEAQAGN